MGFKTVCSIMSPAIKWAAKEFAQNEFVRAYVKARIIGMDPNEACRAATNSHNKSTHSRKHSCPECGRSFTQDPPEKQDNEFKPDLTNIR